MIDIIYFFEQDNQDDPFEEALERMISGVTGTVKDLTEEFPWAVLLSENPRDIPKRCRRFISAYASLMEQRCRECQERMLDSKQAAYDNLTWYAFTWSHDRDPRVDIDKPGRSADPRVYRYWRNALDNYRRVNGLEESDTDRQKR